MFVEQLPLSGITLIEASAGTGKTHTLVELYLRLLLDGGLQVDQILVVTYTKAATSELRQRIRQSISAKRDALTHDTNDIDYRTKLDNALIFFDDAAIFTIHGFCQKVLTDRAFESLLPLKLEVIANESEMLCEVVNDFWRIFIAQQSSLFIQYLLDSGLTPDKLLEEIRPYIGRPYIQINCPVPPSHQEIQQLEHDFLSVWAVLSEIWQTNAHDVFALLTTTPALSRTSYRQDYIVKWWSILESLFAARTPSIYQLCNFDKFIKLTTSELKNATKKAFETPSHEFFKACEQVYLLCQELNESYLKHSLNQRIKLIEYTNQNLAILKRDKGVLGFNDLLNYLAEQLSGENYKVLSAAITKRYQAALIDEFQDTDPVQYQIFKTLYAGTHYPLYFIGDPKQAIYGFRGADIFTYLKASENVASKYSLDTNWRSVPQLVEVINRLFSAVQHPFFTPSITFTPVKATSKPLEPLSILADNPAVMRIWLLQADENSKKVVPLSKEQAHQQAVDTTVREVARLLALAQNDAAHIGQRVLTGGDIAILVRTHRQGQLIQQSLRRQGIASVQQGSVSVYQTTEAAELQHIINALAEPFDLKLIKAAMVTELWGKSAKDITTIFDDERQNEAIYNNFLNYHQLWPEHGFMRMFHELSTEEAFHERLLTYIDGERRLTNLLHLAELIHEKSSHQYVSPQHIVTWFRQQRQDVDNNNESALMRLESDDNIVKIVTMHACKGLQYPIVFCPFLWDSRSLSRSDGKAFYHNPSQAHRPELDFDPASLSQAFDYAEDEVFAEHIRVLYVALTRAIYRCYVVWGNVNGCHSAGLAWLLHSKSISQHHATRLALQGYLKSLSNRQLFDDCQQVFNEENSVVSIESLPLEIPLTSLPSSVGDGLIYQARHYKRPITHGYTISSFTALLREDVSEVRDDDQPLLIPEPPGQSPQEQSIHTFPRGSRVGQFFHSILQFHDFTDKKEINLQEIVRTNLQQYAFADDWMSIVTEHLQNISMTELNSVNGLKLSLIDKYQRINEMEFVLPVTHLAAQRLQQIYLEQMAFAHMHESFKRFNFKPVEGYLKGFIDLIFAYQGQYYLVDYKSNWLGPRIEDYHVTRLTEVIREEAYDLQILLYSVAVHRYLSVRLANYRYETHFAGVYYLFLRGMSVDRGPHYGVYFCKLPERLILAMDDYFSGGD